MKRMNKSSVAFLLAAQLLLLCTPLKGQEEPRRWNVTVSGGAGYMLHEPGLFDELARSFSYLTADVRIGYYTTSEDPSSYAALFGFPSIGLGVNWKGTSHFDWVGKSHLNDLVSLYGFFERDFIRTRKFSFGYDLSLGMAFNSAVHDKDDNPENIGPLGRSDTHVNRTSGVSQRRIQRCGCGGVGPVCHGRAQDPGVQGV